SPTRSAPGPARGRPRARRPACPGVSAPPARAGPAARTLPGWLPERRRLSQNLLRRSMRRFLPDGPDDDAPPGVVDIVEDAEAGCSQLPDRLFVVPRTGRTRLSAPYGPR